MEWYSLPLDQVFKKLQSSENGLSEAEAKKRLEIWGKNEIRKEEKFKTLKIVGRQFNNLFVYILLFASVLSLIIGDWLDSFLIFCFIGIMVGIGFYQEFKANKAVEKLRSFLIKKALVLRDGKEVEIDSRNVVPGDILILKAGYMIPADCRLIEVTELEIDESYLTGESEPVRKEVKTLKGEVPLAERKNMCFLGTFVTHGKGKAVVVATGMQTELGKIAKSVEEEEEQIPLNKKLSVLSKQIALIFTIVVVIVLGIGILNQIPLAEMILFSTSLAVSVIPEALPLIVIVILAYGTLNMAKNNAVMKRLGSIESLGNVNVICTDKTGTLTKNEMTVRKVWVKEEFEITGKGYEPKGKFLKDSKPIDPLKHKKLYLLLKACVLCNDSYLEKDLLGNFWVIGSPTEGALLSMVFKAGMEDLRKRLKLVKLNPFDQKRKLMSTVYEENGKLFAWIKGAPESVVERCNLKVNEKEKILAKVRAYAEEGFRVLAFAFKEVKDLKKVEINLKFIGLVALEDPIREEVIEAIQTCEKAGIKVVIVSGDNKFTVLKVAEKVGLKKGKVVEGFELEKMSEKELREKIDEIIIFARVSPEQKLRIVRAYQVKDYVVAMTGDGINDAPALKAAEIGIAMGKKGTEVAKEAADMVLLDDNFATIVKAVKEGRRIFDNIKKSIVYLLSTAIAEILFISTTLFAKLPLPFKATHILWINLVTEGIPAISLAFEKEEKDVMERKPKKKEEPLMENILLDTILLGVLMGLLTFLPYLFFINDYMLARTLAFNTLVFLEIFNLFNCRSLKEPLHKIGFFTNKVAVFTALLTILLQIVIFFLFPSIFGLAKLTLSEFLLSILIASLILIFYELKKSLKIKLR
jgi:Ca2+-transporting ATPase